MNETSGAVQQLERFFSQNQELDLWLLEFGATHQRGRLRILKQGVTDWVELVFRGCSYICGAPLGGPYRLSVEVVSGEKPHTDQVTISGNDGEFVLRCNHIEIDKTYGEYCAEFFR